LRVVSDKRNVDMSNWTETLDEMKRRAAHALADILPPNAATSDGGSEEQHHLSQDAFPVPELILFGLCKLRDLESWGPGEKLRWGISGTFGKVPFSVTLQKFGLWLYVPKGTSDNVREDLLARLRMAAKLAETCLRCLAEQQIEAGKVTIENQYGISVVPTNSSAKRHRWPMKQDRRTPT
jgi:hypothetical protein